jgi:hypothetical protein
MTPLLAGGKEVTSWLLQATSLTLRPMQLFANFMLGLGKD